MKKIIVCILLTAVLITSVCCTAFAQIPALNGLVANDILTKFESQVDVNPIAGGGAAEEVISMYGTVNYYDVTNRQIYFMLTGNDTADFAWALGEWAKYSVGNLPKDVREMGESIGRYYEFWFGTDTSNNLNNNFARIYSTYFGLKEYYSSNGARGAKFYNHVKNDGIFPVSDRQIKEMYDQMQLFITACNNIIRAK